MRLLTKTSGNENLFLLSFAVGFHRFFKLFPGKIQFSKKGFKQSILNTAYPAIFRQTPL